MAGDPRHRFHLVSRAASPSSAWAGIFLGWTHPYSGGGRQSAPGDAASAAVRFPSGRLPSRRRVPQGLKPGVHGDRCGTTEVVPFPTPRLGGTSIRWRLCGTQGPSTALRSGRDDRVVLQCGDGGVFSLHLWLLSQPRLPPFRKERERIGHPSVWFGWERTWCRDPSLGVSGFAGDSAASR